MYKIKDVCRLTGLTEKTIRFYISQKLISPRIENGLHYKSYYFSDSDIQQLRDISALRSADFSIANIQQMMNDPNSIPSLLAEKEMVLKDKISTMQSIQDVIQNLTIDEQTDFSKIADAIEPRSTQRLETPAYANKRIIWLIVYIGLFLLLGFLSAGGFAFHLLTLLLLFLSGICFPIMAAAYFRYNRKHRSLPHKGCGTIVSVITDEGIDTFWEETYLEALHKLMSIGFIHWNWIRPDHWVPLIQFEVNGDIITSAYRYGAFRNSWVIGSSIEIAWDPSAPKQIYPCADRVIRRKSWIYLVSGIISLVTFLLMVYFGRLQLYH